MKICPHCRRPFAPPINFGGTKRQRLYDYIARNPQGVTTLQCMEHVYADDPNGGPEDPNTISVQIRNINLILARLKSSHRIRSTRGPGAVYRLVEEQKPPCSGNSLNLNSQLQTGSQP